MKYPYIEITPMSTLSTVIVPVRVTSMGQIELFTHLTVCKQMTDVKLHC